MPQLTDRATIRAMLETDRAWAAYALADLEPGFFEHAAWFASDGQMLALVLVYRAFTTPTIITLGDVNTLRILLLEIDTTLQLTTLYAAVRPEIVPLLQERYELTQVKAMHRMVIDPMHFRPHVMAVATRLGPGDLDAVRTLYADGEISGEAPEWFLPEMLSQGVYYGIREAEALIAVAGTHIVAPSEGVGCIGNIYTRRDRRGRGLSSCVTSAVTAALISMQVPTIVLNVRINNAPAIRVYEQLGFVRYCEYVEAVASKHEEPLARTRSGGGKK